MGATIVVADNEALGLDVMPDRFGSWVANHWVGGTSKVAGRGGH